VSAAAAAAADCGALLIVSSPEHGRALSLLPLEHVLLLRAADLREGLADCGDVFEASSSAAVTIIGGPSKTADIEKVLVTGVHGPKRLIVLIIHTINRSHP
jgi:L-lactate dehydrogenase complex protein LldG